MHLCRFFLHLVGVLGSGPPIFSLFRLYIHLLTKRAGYTIDDVYGDSCKVILADQLGPEILTKLEIKGQVLHRVRLHLKVPGWFSDLNALLTRKLPMFLSPLNEISGGREKMCLVSGSLRRILKFLRMTFLTVRFCGW